jgi:hypothetical protein
MRKSISILVVALTLAVATAAMAQTTEVTGRVMRVDPGTQVIVLDNNQAFRVTPNTMLIVNGQPVAIGSLQPGQSVVIRSGEAVAMTPSTAAPATSTTTAQPGVTVPPSQPGRTVVVTQQPASAGPQQTLYGRVTDVDRREIRIKSDNGSFEVKVPRELTSQVRKGDTVRVDLTFQR